MRRIAPCERAQHVLHAPRLVEHIFAHHDELTYLPLRAIERRVFVGIRCGECRDTSLCMHEHVTPHAQGSVRGLVEQVEEVHIDG